MRVTSLIFALCIAAYGQTLGPFSAATNHADDILGVPDTRPATWGTTGYDVHKIEFHPPEGYRTRILRVYGDFQGWLRKNPSGNCVGVLWGLQTTAPEGSTRVTPAADNTLVYRQQAVCGRAPFYLDFDTDVSVAGLLESDNILYSKVAVFMNETGEPVHMEPSFTVVYRFEKQ